MTQLPMPIDWMAQDGELGAAQMARDAGMQQAMDHAEEHTPKWGELAYHFLENFCRTHEHFISEDVSAASKEWGLAQPPDDRAWGSVYRRALKLGIMVQDGSGRSLRRHASICPRWRSLIVGRAS